MLDSVVCKYVDVSGVVSECTMLGVLAGTIASQSSHYRLYLPPGPYLGDTHTPTPTHTNTRSLLMGAVYPISFYMMLSFGS